MTKGISVLPFSVAFLILLFCSEALVENDVVECGLPVVKKNERTPIVVTEYGVISAIEISDGVSEWPYHLQFMTLEPNALLLPVLLHAHMVFYVHTGSGKLTWVDEDKLKSVPIKRGDIYTLRPGSVFYLQSNLETQREKLRIYGIFSHTEDSFFDPSIGAYSSIRELVLGFDQRILQSAFKVPEDVIETIRNTTKPPLIIRAVPKNETKEAEEGEEETSLWGLEARFLKAFVGSEGEGDSYIEPINKKKKKHKTYNIFEAGPDFENCNGWSTTVSKKQLHRLKGTNIGVFMVNLTKGSMMGPHWNPLASEISIVLNGEGMIRVVHSSKPNDRCKSISFKVEEGDVFAVPRYHPMAQMSFNNDTFVFIGFSTSTKNNYPQFLAGKRSVLQVLDREILAVSFNVNSTIIDRLLAPQAESLILDCTSCAEEEWSKLEAEAEKERQEEEEKKRQEEEEAREKEEEKRRKEEEEAEKRREEEEEAQRREEEEAKKREEERKREEEAKKREEERKREEEEAKRKEEERERKAREEEEEAQRREEEEAKKREEERKREEEEAKRREEERERKAREEEEEARRREEEEAQKGRKQPGGGEEEQTREEERGPEEGGGGGGGGESEMGPERVRKFMMMF